MKPPDWDGRRLTLSPEWPSPVALDIDGEFFAETQPAADGTQVLVFPYSPSRCIAFTPVLRRGRGGGVLWPAPADTPEPWRFASAAPHEMLVGRGQRPADVEVAIVVPIFNAPEAVAHCLAGVLEHSTGPARLILIDDASTDPAIGPLLERHVGLAHVEVLRNERNCGFTATANRGIERAGRADVVLLNADTEVSANWLTGLRRAAYSGDDVATATAVSDNAGAFSVPELERANPWPLAWTLGEAARAHWQHAGLAYPQLPTGNGFCMYIRRAVIDTVGALDEAAFPQGYGEENDFCQRASARGGRHVIAGTVFVHHERSLSFGIERRTRLGEAGMRVLRERWPNYEADIGATLFSFERRVLDWRVRQIHAHASRANAPLPRVLAFCPRGGPARVDGFEQWHIDVDAMSLRLWCAGQLIEQSPVDASPLATWLQRHAIELVDITDTAQVALMRAVVDDARRLGVAVANEGSLAPVYSAALRSLRSFPDIPA